MLGKVKNTNSPEKILIKIHRTRKTIENGIADRRGGLGPAVGAATVDLHDRGIIRCCDVVAHVLRSNSQTSPVLKFATATHDSISRSFRHDFN